MPDFENCGTRAGYQRHLAARRFPGDLVLCVPCSTANGEAAIARTADTSIPDFDPTFSSPGPGLYTVLHPTQHGTDGGYRKHMREDLGWPRVPCDECRAAHAVKAKEYRARATAATALGTLLAAIPEVVVVEVKPARVLKPCGTDAAYRRHRRNGESCFSCMEAHNGKVAENRAKARGPQSST